MKTYTTVQGDMWDGIAYAQLGSCAHTDKLMAENLEHRDIYIFPAGLELTLPDVDTTEHDNSLPPWKEVRG